MVFEYLDVVPDRLDRDKIALVRIGIIAYSKSDCMGVNLPLARLMVMRILTEDLTPATNWNAGIPPLQSPVTPASLFILNH